jgi:hypothetical protein
MKFIYGFILLLVGISACSGTAQELVIVDDGVSAYSIIVPREATPLEMKSAKVLQDYVKRVSGKQMPIIKEGDNATPSAIYIGHTKKEGQVILGKLPNEAYRIQVKGKDVLICGGSGKGLIYGVYTFVEKYLGCRKIADAPAITPEMKTVKIPADLKEDGRPQFVYRESFYPASRDPEYLEWNKLQQFEDLWGLWGHSYNKLVPADKR